MPISTTLDPAMQQAIMAQMAAQGKSGQQAADQSAPVGVPPGGQAPVGVSPRQADPNADLKAMLAQRNPQAAGLMASGRYDPAQLAQAMPPAGSPGAGPAMPQAGAGTAVPAGYSTPMGFMPQLYGQGDGPANTPMQQMPNGLSVPQDQAGMAKHALGLDRLPDFDAYSAAHKKDFPIQFENSRNQMLGLQDPHMTFTPAMQQAAILNQYGALQKGQAENDLQGTNRMQAADTGAYQRGQVGAENQRNALAAWQADPRNAATAALLGGVTSGNVQPYQVEDTQKALSGIINTAGVGTPPGYQQGAPPGYPQPQSPAPQGGSILPTQPGAAMPPPVGPPVFDQAAGSKMMPPQSSAMKNGQAGQDPLLNAKTPEEFTNALHKAAEEGLPQVKGQVPQRRSQADIVNQFEAEHQGLLQSSPVAFNAMAAFLGSQPAGPAGLQELWQTRQGNIGNLLGGPPSTAQMAQRILQSARERHTGMTTPQSWMGIPISSSQPLRPPAPAAPRAAYGNAAGPGGY